jgi:YidC/Oxa1 family membrane protein insertase
MTFMAFFLGIVTAWQPAGLQLYFLCSGILGAGTGWLLRQNWFRNLIRIRLLPSRESTELYTRVVKGELRLSDIKGADGKVRYQAPTARTPANRRTTTTLSGIKIKSTAAVPAHLKVQKTKIDPEHPDRDEDYEEGARGSMMDKLDYYRRNYRLSFMYRRMTDSLETMARKRGFGGPKMTTEQRRKKKNADDYEIERRRRFENRS